MHCNCKTKDCTLPTPLIGKKVHSQVRLFSKGQRSEWRKNLPTAVSGMQYFQSKLSLTHRRAGFFLAKKIGCCTEDVHLQILETVFHLASFFEPSSLILFFQVFLNYFLCWLVFSSSFPVMLQCDSFTKCPDAEREEVTSHEALLPQNYVFSVGELLLGNVVLSQILCAPSLVGWKWEGFQNKQSRSERERREPNALFPISQLQRCIFLQNYSFLKPSSYHLL